MMPMKKCDQIETSTMSVPPVLGQPAHWIHVIWLAAFPNDPQEYYDELDAERWSIRCVRIYRDGTSVAASYKSANWRDLMPEAAIDLPDIINRDSQFLAREIERAEFDMVWKAASAQNARTKS
jgi:hypothetical protein